ncbi:glucosaminidase domain-containing protein [Pontibacillus sp. HMF3514]|uniref:glucosaminidase domain-containing protein n=1 Tax=Pontibacillus sp. HMF3514 TaxID=2692425 RepID=UPI0013202DA9|nr:glucosaminidase domain-containing protein [Pontibacillus sp. HMF3514]QHE53608.1 hypothetical protein GS400_17010 [Pontibacillus sp. HMF3514]
MKKTSVILLSFVMMLSLLSPIGKVDAATTWKELESRINVSLDKEFKVNFNVAMDPETINEDTVYVMNYRSFKPHPVETKLSEDGKTLTVSPKENYTLGETYTLHIKQSIKSMREKKMEESIKLSFQTSRDFQIANMNALEDYELGKSYDTLTEAKENVAKDGSQVILENGEVVWMPEGIVRTRWFTHIYEDENRTSAITYVNSSAEMQYLDTVDDGIMIKIADQIGYVKPSDVQLVPNKFIDGQSYYENEDGKLVHHIYQNGGYVQYTYGTAPDSLDEGEKVYSWDGETFEGKEYPFFNQLSLRTETHYTAEELNQFMKRYSPDSPLIGLGDVFIEAQEKFDVNGLYLLSHAIHESAWGKSKIARDKNNLFGINASDDNPYGNADEFKSLESNIMYVAKFVSEKYLTPGNFRYNGDFLGNKSEGMNVKYASDPYWGQKIAGWMFKADQYLGSKDRRLLDPDYEPENTEDSTEESTNETTEEDTNSTDENTSN